MPSKAQKVPVENIWRACHSPVMEAVKIESQLNIVGSWLSRASYFAMKVEIVHKFAIFPCIFYLMNNGNF